MAFISSLIREKRNGNVSWTLGITTEYCGTFSNVGASDGSMLVEFEISMRSLSKQLRLCDRFRIENSLSLPVHVLQPDFGARGDEWVTKART